MQESLKLMTLWQDIIDVDGHSAPTLITLFSQELHVANSTS